MQPTSLTPPTIQTADDIKTLGTILAVWAHPDDETFTSAGILTTAVSNGQLVVCATATKGELGSQDLERWPLDTIASVREKELATALQTLGITHHHWLGYHDGLCDKVPMAEGARQVQELIDRYHPQTVLTFGPDGLTGHPDHATVSKWVSEAVNTLPQPPVVYHAVTTIEQYERYFKEADAKLDIYFNIDKPVLVTPNQCTICFELPSEICLKKCQAFYDMPSQTVTMSQIYSTNQLMAMFGIEAFVRASP